ncbi:MAG: S1C family serine protease [Bacillota bacterium]|jgi:serine protease Do
MESEFPGGEETRQPNEVPNSTYTQPITYGPQRAYTGRTYYHQPPRRYGLTAVMVIAVLSALLGGIASAYLGPSLLYGKYLPWPQSLGQGDYRLPEFTGESPADLAAAGVVAQVADLVDSAVVGITTRIIVQSFFQSFENQAVGSGVIFDPQGYIVTNHHVIEGARDLTVTLAPGVDVQAQLVGSDPVTDLAVIKINPMELPEEYRNLTVAQFGDSDAIRVGELAIAIGNPLGLQFQRSVTAGIISALNRDLQMQGVQLKLIQTDAAINSGNSGGALVNKEGRVIGINQAKIKMEGVEGMGFAIPINTARPVIEQLIQTGRVIRPFLGVTINAELSPQLNRTYNFGTDFGLHVESVSPNSPAALAGMRARDILIKIGDTEIRTFNDLQRTLFEHQVGDEVELTIVRDRVERKLTAKLAATP